MRLSNTLIRPAITEKSVVQAEAGKYVFITRTNATKKEIAKDVHALFNVDVVSVRTILLPGKKRRIIGTRKYTKGTKVKKAIVQVKEGQKIELFPKE